MNENKKMFLDMMGPVNAQLTEMKGLYENTKSASSEVGGKIEDLKKIIQM